MISILDFAKQQLLDCRQEEGIYLDLTMGNGHDTLFLTHLAPRGRIYAFDVQQQALDSTARLLEEQGEAGAGQRVTLILDSHSQVDQYVRERIDGGIFNLGYLPYSDKRVTTRHETTLEAVQKVLTLLKPQRRLVIVVYPGHPEGRLEGECLQQYLSTLPGKRVDVLLFRLLNSPDAPYVIAVNKRKEL